jgi:hypothetical protein
VLPIEKVSPQRIPRHAIDKAYGFGGGEEHLGNHDLGRLGLVATDLIHAERDRLILSGILALDDEDRETIDQKDNVLPRPVMAVIDVQSSGGKSAVVPHAGDDGQSRAAVARIQSIWRR